MRLTMRGWEKFTELERQGAATSQAFVAMWFDNSTQPVLLIQPSVTKALAPGFALSYLAATVCQAVV
jgi:hypothetical protein